MVQVFRFREDEVQTIFQKRLSLAFSAVLPVSPPGSFGRAGLLGLVARDPLTADRRLLVPGRDGRLSPTPVGGRGPRTTEPEPQGACRSRKLCGSAESRGQSTTADMRICHLSPATLRSVAPSSAPSLLVSSRHDRLPAAVEHRTQSSQSRSWAALCNLGQMTWLH